MLLTYAYEPSAICARVHFSFTSAITSYKKLMSDDVDQHKITHIRKMKPEMRKILEHNDIHVMYALDYHSCCNRIQIIPG